MDDELSKLHHVGWCACKEFPQKRFLIRLLFLALFGFAPKMDGDPAATNVQGASNTFPVNLPSREAENVAAEIVALMRRGSEVLAGVSGNESVVLDLIMKAQTVLGEFDIALGPNITLHCIATHRREGEAHEHISPIYSNTILPCTASIFEFAMSALSHLSQAFKKAKLATAEKAREMRKKAAITELTAKRVASVPFGQHAVSQKLVPTLLPRGFVPSSMPPPKLSLTKKLKVKTNCRPFVSLKESWFNNPVHCRDNGLLSLHFEVDKAQELVAKAHGEQETLEKIRVDELTPLPPPVTRVVDFNLNSADKYRR